MQDSAPLFVGNFEHTLDAKGRLVLPAAFRGALAGGLYLAPGSDTFVVGFTRSEYESVSGQLEQLARAGEYDADELRDFRAFSVHEVPDGQGRILVPDVLRRYAGLGPKVMVVGNHNRFELWAPELRFPDGVPMPKVSTGRRASAFY